MPATAHRARARAKVNLALHVLGRRADGYHELHSIVVFADIADRLHFDEGGDRLELALSGRLPQTLPQGEDNLVLQGGARHFRCFSERASAVRIALEKNMPVASGLGGGSADAAAALRGLARLLALDLSRVTSASNGWR